MSDGENASTCSVCGDGAELDFGFSMAFQPIVDVEQGRAYAYEALVRGLNGEGAGHVLAQVKSSNRYRFDQACRVRAIELAASSGIGDAQLNINFLPNAVYEPSSCIQTTLRAASKWGMPPERICLEVVESERIDDHAHVVGILEEYKRCGLVTAIDDFGAGHAGLNLLAEFQPDNLTNPNPSKASLSGSLPGQPQGACSQEWRDPFQERATPRMARQRPARREPQGSPVAAWPRPDRPGWWRDGRRWAAASTGSAQDDAL